MERNSELPSKAKGIFLSASLGVAGRDARFKLFTVQGRLPLAIHCIYWKEDVYTSIMTVEKPIGEY